MLCTYRAYIFALLYVHMTHTIASHQTSRLRTRTRALSRICSFFCSCAEHGSGYHNARDSIHQSSLLRAHSYTFTIRHYIHKRSGAGANNSHKHHRALQLHSKTKRRPPPPSLWHTYALCFIRPRHTHWTHSNWLMERKVGWHLGVPRARLETLVDRLCPLPILNYPPVFSAKRLKMKET